MGSNGEEEKFNHPGLQSLGLNIVEICCLLYLLSNSFECATQQGKENMNKEENPQSKEGESNGEKESSQENENENTDINIFHFLVPAIFHLAYRLLSFFALLYTSASSFVMLQGTNLVWSSILSKIFLKKSLPWYKWISIGLNSLGLLAVGLSDWLIGCENELDSNPILGNALVVLSMFCYACQLACEEKFVKKYNVNTWKVIGLEGIFALPVLIPLLIVFSFTPNVTIEQPGSKLDDFWHGLVQLYNNPLLLLYFVATAIALCLYQVSI